MKIHHYDAYYKYYMHSEEIEKRIDGVGLPAHSTDIKPPLEECTSGQIPVFKDNSWEIVVDDFSRPSIFEINYDAGREMNTFKLIEPNMHDFINFPSFPQVCNSQLVGMRIYQSLLFINKKFNYCNKLYEVIVNNIMHDPSIIYEFKIELESIVFNMRRVLDTLVQLTDLLVNFSSIEKHKKINFDSIGAIICKNKKKSTVLDIILGNDIYENDATGFLEIINDLANSFKHILIHDETFNLIGEQDPTIVTLYAPHNNYKKEINYHNHNVYHIMMGFQDCISRICKNQELYRKNSTL